MHDARSAGAAGALRPMWYWARSRRACSHHNCALCTIPFSMNAPCRSKSCSQASNTERTALPALLRSRLHISKNFVALPMAPPLRTRFQIPCMTCPRPLILLQSRTAPTATAALLPHQAAALMALQSHCSQMLMRTRRRALQQRCLLCLLLGAVPLLPPRLPVQRRISTANGMRVVHKRRRGRQRPVYQVQARVPMPQAPEALKPVLQSTRHRFWSSACAPERPRRQTPTRPAQHHPRMARCRGSCPMRACLVLG